MRAACGVAVYPDDAGGSQGLLRCADLAVRRAKVLERPYVVYSEIADEEIPPSLVLETDLEAAIETGELENHYQPKIDLQSRTITGVEALARWTTSIHGPVRPDVFVGLAERTGLIMPLTLWSLITALRQSRELQERVGNIGVSINLSGGILHEPEVDDLVSRTMKIWNADPGQVTYEVTESAMMADPSASLKKLQELNAKGINGSIDDFGTGYSSLAYLKNLPVQELKIDKSFVMRMAEDRGDARIVRTIIDLAENFEIAVVAEGVENQETLESVASMGCNTAQGFYMGRPMPLEDLIRWVDESPWGGGGKTLH